MKKVTSATRFLTSLVESFDPTFLVSLLGIVRRIVASVAPFRNQETTPRSFDPLERRLERYVRELARLILEWTLNRVESHRWPAAKSSSTSE